MKRVMQKMEQEALNSIGFQKLFLNSVSFKKPLVRKIIRLDDYEFQCVFRKLKSLGSVTSVIRNISWGLYTYDNETIVKEALHPDDYRLSLEEIVRLIDSARNRGFFEMNMDSEKFQTYIDTLIEEE